MARLGVSASGPGGLAGSLQQLAARTRRYRDEGMSGTDARAKAEANRASADGGSRSETEEERKRRLAAAEKHRQDTLLGGGA